MAPEDVEYTGDAMFTNDEDQEEILMRVMIVGAGEQEGQFVKNLSEKGSTTLVSGLYTLWDPRCEEGYNKRKRLKWGGPGTGCSTPCLIFYWITFGAPNPPISMSFDFLVCGRTAVDSVRPLTGSAEWHTQKHLAL